MNNLFDALTNQSQFQASTGFVSNDSYFKKVLGNGDNRFRPVGDIKFFYTHRFDAKNGVRVLSVCTKDSDGNGECPICREYKNAWAICNAIEESSKSSLHHSYTSEQIEDAYIKTGKIIHPKLKFKQSIGPKRFAIFNVLDRDSDINKREQHYSLICKSEYDLGLSAGTNSVYEQVSKLLFRNRDEIARHFQAGYDWIPFDINLIREGKGIGTSYERERTEAYPLTAEELAYKRYDLNVVIKPTPESTLVKWLTVGTSKKSQDDEQESLPQRPVAQQATLPPVQQRMSTPTPQVPPKTQLPPAQVFGQQKNVFAGATKAPSFVSPNAIDQSSSTSFSSTQRPPVEAVAQPQIPLPSTGFKKVAKELPPAPPVAPIVNATEVEQDYCPSCEKLIPVTSSKCPFCGEEFETYESGDNVPF